MGLIKHHTEMAAAMTRIVDALPLAWPVGLRDGARAYLAANEYGVALEMLVSGVAEQGLMVPQAMESSLSCWPTAWAWMRPASGGS